MAMQEQASDLEQGTDREWRSSGLWRALDAMRIEPEGAALTFAERLARENGWSRAYADAVVHEYKRFLYLGAGAKSPITPSDEVDQAWHLHLTYSRHYWQELCGRILRRKLHHEPTAGGGSEQHRYGTQYEETLERYRTIFGEEPPVAVWPRARERFSGRPVRVDRSDYWLVPKALPARAGVAGAATLIGACSLLAAASGGDGGGAMEIVVAVGVVIFAAVVFLAIIKAPAKGGEKKEGGCGGVSVFGDGGGGGDGGCGGGCGGCGG